MFLTQSCPLGAYLNLEQVLCRFDESGSQYIPESFQKKMYSRAVKALVVIYMAWVCW